MKKILRRQLDSGGFTAIEVMVSIVVMAIIVIGLVGAYKAISRSYVTARQLNEIYTVLSACPEVDRALEFNSLTSTNNCYPNNSFPAENSGGGTITYSPTLTVVNASSLPASDQLQSVPDSKVIDISVGFPAPNQSAPNLELRMLITRNGIGQL